MYHPAVPWARNGVDVTVSPSTEQGVVRVHFDMDHPITTWNGTSNPQWHVNDIVKLALTAIYEEPSATFDFRNSQKDLHVYAIVAGGDASAGSGVGSGQVHAQASAVVWLIHDDIHIQRYGVHGELEHFDNIRGIGVAVHELGHTLGLPDLYAYNISGIPRSQGLGYFCAMAMGSWGARSGERAGVFPVGLSAWSMEQLGYVMPVAIPASENRKETLSSLASNPAEFSILKITHPADSQQYYLVENRQASSGWDRGMQLRVGGHQGGILVYHVDMSMLNQSDNSQPRRKTVDLVEADGTNFLDTMDVSYYHGHDAFFRMGGNFYLGPSTNPNSNFYEPRRTEAFLEEGIRDVVTGIHISTPDARADIMRVQVGASPEILENLIAKAWELLNDTEISTNGFDIPKEKFWATQSAHDDFREKILDAMATLD